MEIKDITIGRATPIVAKEEAVEADVTEAETVSEDADLVAEAETAEAKTTPKKSKK